MAKAYRVFMDEDLNKKYHFFLDHPVSTHQTRRFLFRVDCRNIILFGEAVRFRRSILYASITEVPTDCTLRNVVVILLLHGTMASTFG